MCSLRDKRIVGRVTEDPKRKDDHKQCIDERRRQRILARHATTQHDHAVTNKREQHKRDRHQEKRVERESSQEVTMKNLVHGSS